MLQLQDFKLMIPKFLPRRNYRHSVGSSSSLHGYGSCTRTRCGIRWLQFRDGTQELLLDLLLFWFCFLLIINLIINGAAAQQDYNNINGYTCIAAAGSSRSCESYALYRTQSSAEDLATVSALFNTTATRIATASSLNLTSKTLPSGTPLYIPLLCNCVQRSSTYQATVWHTIVPGDTFYKLANNTYEGLTTYQAIEAANRTQNPNDLMPGSQSAIPLRCACPSSSQLANGARFLLSFVLFPGETSLAVVNSYFNVSVAVLEAANNLISTSSNGSSSTNPKTLQPFSTLLVPLFTLPPLPSSPASTDSPSPQLPPPLPPSPAVASASGTGSSHKSSIYLGLGIGISIGLMLVLLGIFGLMFAYYRRKLLHPRRHGHDREGGGGGGGGGLSMETETGSKILANGRGDSSSLAMLYDHGNFQEDVLLAEMMSDLVGSDKPLMFSYKELRDATEDFSDANRIQGCVFAGELHGVFVAIKQMKGNMTQELRILTQVHHRNLLKLVGMCLSSSEHLYLVYEYAENGSLSDCLHNREADPSSNNSSRSIAFLPWTTRVQIALDVASGLDYIHNYTNPSFVHKDVKSSNILLDGKFRAKVANFGMAKSVNHAGSGAAVGVSMLTRHIVGTQGYMAPEYLEHGLVTPKADVFAFGVVLLELLSGQEAMVRPVEDGDHGELGTESLALSSLIRDVLEGGNRKEKLQAWIDPLLQNVYPLDTACIVATLAKTCVDSDPALRPNMKDITYALSKMLASSLEWEPSAIFAAKDMTEVSVETR